MGALAPGFRFCPTDEELLIYYLRPKAWGKAFPRGTIAEVDIYKFEPWDLPDKSALSTKDPEWYFFSTQDKKYSHTARINRTTTRGYWKATGKDRKVWNGPFIVGLKKTLIYYEGRAPNGRRTDWIMHEYRLDQESEKKEKGSSVSVLCRIRKKGGPGPRNGEQYGAPVWNDDGETDDESKLVKKGVSNDAGLLGEGNLDGGNAFNLQNQVEGLRSPRRLGLVKVEPSDIDNDVDSARTMNEPLSSPLNTESARDGIMVCEKDVNGDLKSNFDAHTPCFDTAPNMWEDPSSWHHPYMDLQEMGTLFDFESLPVLPTLTDFDGQNLRDYVIPDFDEPEIIGEMWSLVHDGQYALGSMGVDNQMVASQFARDFLTENVSHVGGGNYIELDDMEAPLGGLARSPTHVNAFADMEAPLGGLARLSTHVNAFADNRPPTTGVVQDSLPFQGSVAQRIHLQVPALSFPEERVKNAVTSENDVATQTLHPQVNKIEIHGGSEDIGILKTKEGYKNANAGAKNTKSKVADSYYGSNFNSCNMPYAVESSTRSYLSKHTSTYAVSKFEIAPQLCYASLTENQDGRMEAIKKIDSLTTSSVKDANHTQTEKPEIVPVELCYASFLDIQDCSSKVDKKSEFSTAVVIKDENEIDADAPGKKATCSLDATASTSLLTKHNIFNGNKPEGIASLVSKVCNCKGCLAGSSLNRENASMQGFYADVKAVNMSSSRRHSLRTSLKGLKNKLKQSALGTKFIQLEEGMRTKFSDRHFAHGKPAAQLFPTEDDSNAFSRLKNGILAILYCLATAVLILSCLIWGYHIVTKYATHVSVQ